MRKKWAALFFLLILNTVALLAQQETPINDSINPKYLPDITIVGRNSKSDYQQLPEVVGTHIYAGKKNALIVLDNVQGNVVNNTMRQVLAKVAGIHIWESDPSGIQIGIATRGLSPNRSWEFNMRQNGYDIAADPFGYPEAYYNPPLQAVQRIEVIRGQGSLQYGPQFGGMVNYILRNGSEISKPLELETQQAFGSHGLFNSFLAMGGKKKKVHYYTFFDHRNGEGWRPNSNFFTNGGYATITYSVSEKFSVTAELMRSHIRSQQPGGLTDLMFYDNPRQSWRARNWMDIHWANPAIIANYQINKTTRWNTKLFGTIGNRNSVGFLQPMTIKDSINVSTLAYANRVLNLDRYRNYGLESRLLTDYQLGKFKNTVSVGLRLYTGTTSRLADGKGTTGSDYDISILGNYPRDIQFQSNNLAVCMEHIVRFSEKLIFIPGIRYEWIEGTSSGRAGYTANGAEIILQNIKRKRAFLLAGLGGEYHATRLTELYANISQAYRPIQFANLQAPPSTDVVDPNLTDAKGYNLDLGYRGKLSGVLQFDISVFCLQYNDRIGTIIPAGASYRLITNIGASTSRGMEGYAEFNLLKALHKNKETDLLLFGSYSYTHATYSQDHKDANTKGKLVENAPANIFRGGISAGNQFYLLTAQLSSVSKAFSDATNTLTPSANGNTGLIPAYTIIDLSARIKLPKGLLLKAGINNILNTSYFTRRAGGYPGPGLLPGEERNFFISMGAKL